MYAGRKEDVEVIGGRRARQPDLLPPGAGRPRHDARGEPARVERQRQWLGRVEHELVRPARVVDRPFGEQPAR